MSGNKKVVLDSNVLILASKHQVDTSLMLNDFEDLYISIVSYIEVYAYDFPSKSEKQAIDLMTETFDLVGADLEIAKIAIEYRKNKTKKIKLPDAVILLEIISQPFLL